MAAEARAMLDALMGSDRNANIPASGEGRDNFRKNKKSCYDHNICPFYCAWGVDIYELFTNTKSDLGENPNVVQEDAREEFLSLPDHEKDRLGYEYMLYRKVGDLVRESDRIVNRNKEKLRVEKSKAARARGSGATIDPATDVKDEMIMEAAECMADLELREEEVKKMVEKLMSLDVEWKDYWKGLNDLKEQHKKTDSEKKESKGEDGGKSGEAEKKDGGESSKGEESSDAAKEGTAEGDDKGENFDDAVVAEKTKELKSKLFSISSEQQKIISNLSILTAQTIVPLRDNLQNLNKQLYYVKTDTSSDKTVCEVSGNFMSSRDAEERIAAHYAGKQYVGWKMVRDKYRELHKKYANARPSMGGGPPPRHGPGGYGYNNGPPPSYNRGYGHGPPHGYGPPHGRYNDRGGHRPRDDNASSRRHNDRKRSPSPSRWQRDQYDGGGGRRRYGGGGGSRRY